MKKIKMSVLGIGPVYVLSCLIVTVLSIYLSEKGSLNSGKISNFRLILICLGVLSILLGVILWIQAVFSQKRSLCCCKESDIFCIFLCFYWDVIDRSQSLVTYTSNSILALYDYSFKTYRRKVAKRGFWTRVY